MKFQIKSLRAIRELQKNFDRVGRDIEKRLREENMAEAKLQGLIPRTIFLFKSA